MMAWDNLVLLSSQKNYAAIDGYLADTLQNVELTNGLASFIKDFCVEMGVYARK